MPPRFPQNSLTDLAVFSAPGVFLVLWSSGFIGSKLGMPYAEPMTFLTIRMAAVIALLGAIVLITRPKWPGRAELGHSAMIGLLVHGCYLGGVFVAIAESMPAGLVALIVALQPVLTSTLANRLLGERVTPRQWLGLALGIVGVYFVVHARTEGEGTLVAWIAVAVALLGITAGTLYQKRFGGEIEWRTGFLVQYAAAGVVFALAALMFETREVQWTAAVHLRGRISRVGAVVRRDLAVLFPDPAHRDVACREPALSDAATDRLDVLGAVRRAAGAVRARRHGDLRHWRRAGELADRAALS